MFVRVGKLIINTSLITYISVYESSVNIYFSEGRSITIKPEQFEELENAILSA